jgi:hypothetical protein
VIETIQLKTETRKLKTIFWGASMTDRTKLGILVLIVAFALGVFGDILLRAKPWGLNLFVWIVALVASVVFIVRWRRVALNGSGRWLAAMELVSQRGNPSAERS